jgi:hypothetical protein
VGAAGVLAGITIVLALLWLPAEAPTQAAEAPTTAPAPPPVVESAPPPSWTGQRRAAWSREGSRTISFELQATRDLPVWMSRARPVLVVRCLYGATEAFVALETSTAFESETDRRTIQLQWDEDPPLVQQWETSETGQELFAPGGVAFVRQLARVKRLRFGFTPFNAPPVTAEFAVQGFDQLAGLVAGTCKWRLDGGTTPTRSARLD